MKAPQAFRVQGHNGYRFTDTVGRGCSIVESKHGLMLGVNTPDGPTRMHLDDDTALWLVRVILHYVETGEL